MWPVLLSLLVRFYYCCDFNAIIIEERLESEHSIINPETRLYQICGNHSVAVFVPQRTGKPNKSARTASVNKIKAIWILHHKGYLATQKRLDITTNQAYGEFAAHFTPGAF